ncbi:MAG: hypothetical protein EHM42_09330, partial [Planctomycetaceae bacterium]
MDRPTTRTPNRPVLLRGLWLSAVAWTVLQLSGCQIVIGVLNMLQGPPMVTAHFTQITKKRLDEKNKKVVVLSTADSPALASHPSLPVDVAQQVAAKLRVKGVKTADAAEVTKYLETGAMIDERSDFGEIGRKFEADYVVLISFEEFSTRQENSAGLYRGTARAKIYVWELTKKGDEDAKAERIYRKVHDT